MDPDQSASTVSDVMLRHPKTLSAEVTVADARRVLENASVKMLLLVDGDRFQGAVTAIPDDAEPDARALDFSDETAPVAAAETPLSLALGELDHRSNGRIIVLDDAQRLVGLVCLARDGVTFCGS